MIDSYRGASYAGAEKAEPEAALRTSLELRKPSQPENFIDCKFNLIFIKSMPLKRDR